jgi:hypothetical protein
MLAIMLIAAALPSMAGSTGKNYSKEAGKVVLETDTLAVEITGGQNIPAFFFWEIGNESVTYKVQFNQVFEAIDENSNGIFDLQNDSKVLNSQVSLASLEWDFSEFLVVEEDNSPTEVHFNITSTDSSKGQGEAKTLMIEFRIHFTAESELKFDIAVEDYEFINETAMLVFGFKLLTTMNENTHRLQNRVQFGNGYFESEEIAESNGTALQVGLSAGSQDEQKMIFLAYEHFDGSFVHDPTIGVTIADSTASQTDGDETTDQKTGTKNRVLPELSKADLFTSSVVASLVFILIPVAIYMKRKP